MSKSTSSLYKRLSAGLLLAVGGITQPALAAPHCDEIVQFKPGTRSAVKSGTISGYEVVDYCLWGRAGQRLSAQVYGATDIDAFVYTLDADADLSTHRHVIKKNGYVVVRVAQMRAKARMSKRPKPYQIGFSLH